MTPPPDMIDGAKVLLWSFIDSRHCKTNHICLYVGTVEQVTFSGVALARYEGNPSPVYAFYCDSNWETLNDSDYATLEEAKAESERLFLGLSETWSQE